jgi:hypothetical protein
MATYFFLKALVELKANVFKWSHLKGVHFKFSMKRNDSMDFFGTYYVTVITDTIYRWQIFLVYVM